MVNTPGTSAQNRGLPNSELTRCARGTRAKREGHSKNQDEKESTTTAKHLTSVQRENQAFILVRANVHNNYEQQRARAIPKHSFRKRSGRRENKTGEKSTKPKKRGQSQTLGAKGQRTGTRDEQQATEKARKKRKNKIRRVQAKARSPWPVATAHKGAVTMY